MPRIEQYLVTVGRMLYVVPVIRAMIATDWSRGQVRPLFERVKGKHHQITVRKLDKLLKKAGL